MSIETINQIKNNEESNNIMQKLEEKLIYDEDYSINDTNSVKNELEQLFNNLYTYNHHIKIFKKLLNLRELTNQHNFFSFNSIDQKIDDKKNEVLDDQKNNEFDKDENKSNNSIDKDDSIKLQLNKIKEQFLESQLLVTCLVHNLQILKKRYCGSALDSITSGELLAELEKDHNELKSCKSIFKYQCNEKRKQITKLKTQLQNVREDWNQLIVRKPTKTKLTNEELILLNKTKNLKNYDVKEEKQEILNSEKSIDINLKKKIQKDSLSSIQKDINLTSALHSNPEINSFQELTAAIYRRKNKLDRLERECYSFMSRLANKNKVLKINNNKENSFKNFNYNSQLASENR